jgi:Protein of unknown function (DUF1524)
LKEGRKKQPGVYRMHHYEEEGEISRKVGFTPSEFQTLLERLLHEGYVSNNGRVNGFHVEHVLSRNEGNVERFDGDEERFEQERNRLGAVLLLKGLHNISSNNEPYEEKTEDLRQNAVLE